MKINIDKIEINYEESILIYDNNVIFIKDKELLIKIASNNIKVNNKEEITIEIKNILFITMTIIAAKLNNIEDIENYISKFLYNDLMSFFDDLNEEEKENIKKKEAMISLKLWNNLENKTKENILIDSEAFDMSNSEMFNLLTFLMIDNKYFNGIMVKEINTKETIELRKLKGDTNGSKK